MTAIVCSKCAEGRPSSVTTVHPSSRTFTFSLPRLIIGSIAITKPGFTLRPLATLDVVQYRRIFMEGAADAMATKLADDSKVMFVGECLNRSGYIRKEITRARRLRSLYKEPVP